MATCILQQFLGANLEGVSSAEQLFKNNGKEIRDWVRQRMVVLFGAWMTKIGHTRPGVTGGPEAAPGLPIQEATSKAADITRQIADSIARDRNIT